MTIKEMKELALYAAKGQAPANYSTETVNGALLDGFKNLLGSNRLIDFQRHKLDIFEIIGEVADEVMPQRLDAIVGMFAETRYIKQGDTLQFRRKIGKNRAKRHFITAAGLSGVYETFRLDSETYSIRLNAVGGAAIIDFERMLDGFETISDVMEVIADGLVENVIAQVIQALLAAAGQMTSANYYSNAYDADKMASMVAAVKAHGNGAVIFASPEFIAAMGPDAIVPAISTEVGVAQGVYSPDDIDAIHKTGLIKIFRGTPVVELPNGYKDEVGGEKWLPVDTAFILPTTGSKVVKIVVEGQTQMYDFMNRDQSWELHFYRKIGVAIESYNTWGMFINSSL